MNGNAATNTDSHVKSILGWLALAQSRQGSDDADQLHAQLLLLRDAPIPGSHRLMILDLLFGHAERITLAAFPKLQEFSLPIPRKARQRVRILLDLLQTLTQDYFNTLAELFDPSGPSNPRTPAISLRRAMHTIAWQVRIAHLTAAPVALGLWQQLHAAYRTARRLGIDDFPGPNGGSTIRRLYSGIILTAIAQPVSFLSKELEFISEYVEECTPDIQFHSTAPSDAASVFWLDPEKDFPAHALIRRIPGPEADILFFSCDAVAATAEKHRDELLHGVPPDMLGLPEFAGTHAGPGVLLRLSRLWGKPTRRRFSRRRQSYRANVCAGLGNLWHLIKSSEKSGEISEWMVTNESPDGYSLMHIAGDTEHVRVGDIVAIRANNEANETPSAWHVCVIRWAISENPEHVEIGLQIIAPKAIPVEVATAGADDTNKVAALILPAAPPLRKTQSLVVPPGLIGENAHRIIVLLEDSNLKIRELQTTSMDEQTSSIEIFTVLPEASR